MNVKKLYEKVYGTDDVRKARRESDASANARLKIPDILKAPKNSVEREALIEPLSLVLWHYLRTQFPDTSPELALKKLEEFKTEDERGERAKIFKSSMEASEKQDKKHFEDWSNYVTRIKKGMVPSCRDERYDWGKHEIKGLGIVFNFEEALCRDFDLKTNPLNLLGRTFEHRVLIDRSIITLHIKLEPR